MSTCPTQSQIIKVVNKHFRNTMKSCLIENSELKLLNDCLHIAINSEYNKKYPTAMDIQDQIFLELGNDNINKCKPNDYIGDRIFAKFSEPILNEIFPNRG